MIVFAIWGNYAKISKWRNWIGAKAYTANAIQHLHNFGHPTLCLITNHRRGPRNVPKISASCNDDKFIDFACRGPVDKGVPILRGGFSDI